MYLPEKVLSDDLPLQSARGPAVADLDLLEVFSFATWLKM
jgi:hypothetical protein